MRGDDNQQEGLNPHPKKRRVDWIRTKAPFVAEYASVWRTEAFGRKEPSMMIIGCDCRPSW
jgi:hypothetical protein